MRYQHGGSRAPEHPCSQEGSNGHRRYVRLRHGTAQSPSPDRVQAPSVVHRFFCVNLSILDGSGTTRSQCICSLIPCCMYPYLYVLTCFQFDLARFSLIAKGTRRGRKVWGRAWAKCSRSDFSYLKRSIFCFDVVRRRDPGW